MRISGLQKLTLLDYPGRVACTVFTSGCNFRCPFCHNADLALNKPDTDIPEDEFFEFLESRKGKLNGVAITGGEPTIHKDLPEFIEKIRNMDYLVKLDTNGTNPDMLRRLVSNRLVNYVAMDIKAGYSNYNNAIEVTSNILDIMNKITQSINILKTFGVEYEFRTTVVGGIHSDGDFYSIRAMISGAEKYYLQSYKDSGNIIDNVGLREPTIEELKRYKKLCELGGLQNVVIRGVDDVEDD